MNDGKWDTRIRRAQELAAAHPFASEGLRFYERVTGFQRSLYSEIRAACGHVKEFLRPARCGRNWTSLFCYPDLPLFFLLWKQTPPARWRSLPVNCALREPRARKK